MRLSDTLSGFLALIVGAAVAGYAWTFPPMPGQAVGPGLFPMVIGFGCIVFGAALMLSGMRRSRRWWIEFDDWARRPRMVANFALVVAAVAFYVLAVDWLGFFITATIFLGALFLAFGVRRTRVVPVAVAVTIVIHYGFYTLLRVPLPWGVLEGIAW